MFSGQLFQIASIKNRYISNNGRFVSDEGGGMICSQPGLDLVLLTSFPNPTCMGFGGLMISNPCIIMIQSDQTPRGISVAEEIHRMLVAEVRQLSSNVRRIQVPCGGHGHWASCMGFNDPSCEHVLVLVSGGTGPFSDLTLANQFIRSGAKFHVLPVLPNKSNVQHVFAPPVSGVHAAFTDSGIQDVVADVLTLGGLANVDRRIFICYRRNDTQELAEQLRDELSRSRFDVFLDQFSLPPGIDVQQRISDELSHKSMVVVLESRDILRSKWTTFEINYALQNRIGLLALQLPNGVAVPGIQEHARCKLERTQFTNSRKVRVLRKSVLNKIKSNIVRRHAVALQIRRQYLRDVMRDALLICGVTNQSYDYDGVLLADEPTGARRRIAINLIPRPPELRDFHCTSGHTSGASPALVIGPATGGTLASGKSLEWLSNVSSIKLADEGRILEIARSIANGTL